MRTFGFYWGVFGVIGLITAAVYRVTPYALELRDYDLTVVQWLILLGFTGWMLYVEGLRGFHRNLAPRVVARACYLREHSRPLLTLLAPAFCMGYIHATRRRQLTSFIVTGTIAAVVILVRMVPQPWRGIIDSGVVGGLMVGIVSLFWHGGRAAITGKSPVFPIDLP